MDSANKIFADWVASDRESIERLPYFADSDERAHAIAVMHEELSRHDLSKILAWENGTSDPIYRVMALALWARMQPAADPTRWGATHVDDARTIDGDLLVDGNLEIGGTGILRVRGNLVVTGAVTTELDYPNLQVVGDLRCKSFAACEAETLVLGTLDVAETLLVVYNHTVTIADRVRSTTVALDDAGLWARVEAGTTYRDQVPYMELFGVSSEDDEYGAAVAAMRATPPAQ